MEVSVGVGAVVRRNIFLVTLYELTFNVLSMINLQALSKICGRKHGIIRNVTVNGFGLTVSIRVLQ